MDRNRQGARPSGSGAKKPFDVCVAGRLSRIRFTVDTISPLSDETTTTPRTDSAPAQRRISLTTLATYIAMFFLICSLRAIVFIRIDEGIESEFWKRLYPNAIKFIIWVVPVFIILRLAGLPPLAYLKLTTRVNKRGLLAGGVVTLVWFSLVVLGEALIQRRNAGAMLAARSSEWLSILAGVFFSPIWEEILFRGFFLNRLNESLSF